MSTQKKFELLLKALETTYPPLKILVLRSFLQGISFGLGTSIGLSLVIALITAILNQLRVFPALEVIIQNLRLEEVIDGSR